LPILKLYNYPNKKHIIKINCISKDKKDEKINSQTLVILNIELVYVKNSIYKTEFNVKKIIFD
jgi:hypothetical protein